MRRLRSLGTVATGVVGLATLVILCGSGHCGGDDVAEEVCDGIDNNGDGQIDEGFDADGDGYTSQACECRADGETSCGLDCNGDEPSINPEGTESCNLYDDNCNGQLDEGIQITYYRDQDQDGYGDADDTTDAGCEPPPSYVANDLDCDDSDPDVNPGAQEISGDGIDQNCDGEGD